MTEVYKTADSKMSGNDAGGASLDDGEGGKRTRKDECSWRGLRIRKTVSVA